MATIMTITFNTTDGKSHRFEGEDGHAAYLQFLDRKYEEIFIPGDIEKYIVKRHIASVVISD